MRLRPDVAVGPPPSELESLPIGTFTVWAQVPPPGHAWAHRARVSMEELVAEPLVMHTPEHGTRRLFDQAVNEASLKYRMVVEASVSEVAQSLAVGSLGVAVVSDDARYGLRALAIETGGRDLRFELFAAWDPTHFAAATIEAWAQQLAGSTARTGGRPAQVRKRPRRPPGPRGQHRAVQPGMAPTGPAGEGGPDATR